MHKLTSDQVSRLIELVRDNPVLYNKDIEGYTSKERKDRIWLEVGKKIGVNNAKVCLKAWRSLRDQFLRCHRTQGNDGNTRRHYKYYEALMFLTDFVHKKKKQEDEWNFNKFEDDSRSSLAPFEQIEFQPFRELSEKSQEATMPVSVAPLPDYQTNNCSGKSESPCAQLVANSLETLLNRIPKENDETDRFFLVLSSMVKHCNLSYSEFANLQCYLINEVRNQLQSMGKL